MKNFRDFLKENLLTEEPHIELIPSKDQYWDFCSEEAFKPADMKDGGWLKQLYNIYADHVVITLNPNKNDPRVLNIDPKDIPEITKTIATNRFFINRVRNDYQLTNTEFRDKLMTVLPFNLVTLLNKGAE